MVKITDECIECDGCIDECPVEAIVDSDDNPDGKDTYYVYQDKCIECQGFNDIPACAESCPSEGAIVWAEVGDKISTSRPSDAINQNVIND